MSANATVAPLTQRSETVGWGISLVQKTMVVGRDPTCDIVVADLSVSRKHAELSTTDAVLTIRDLESKSGTFVDDERVTIGTVHPGQRLRFGNVVFTVAIGNSDRQLVNAEAATESVDESSARSRVTPEMATLSTAEQRVFALLLQGKTEKEISRQFDLSHHTVHNHVRAIYFA